MSKPYNRKDTYYKQAKAEGYRSRAAYKLKELHDKFKLFKKGDRVADLGCWPGGWVQVACGYVGESGKVIGVDLVECDPLPFSQALLISGDVRDDSTIAQLMEQAPDGFDLVISDMSPKHTGIREADVAAMSHCSELSLWAAQRLLKPGGHWVTKVFRNHELGPFVQQARPYFEKVNQSD